MTARILTVCTGNICRSPLAEALIRSGVEGLPVTVESAGTGALDGEQATVETVELGTQLARVDLGSHRSRYLTEDILEGVDLVLTMTIRHSSSVLSLAPALAKRTFTIREFAGLAASTDVSNLHSAEYPAGSGAADRLRALAHALSAARGSVKFTPNQLQVADPYRRGKQAYLDSAGQLVPAVDVVVQTLRTSLTR